MSLTFLQILLPVIFLYFFINLFLIAMGPGLFGPFGWGTLKMEQIFREIKVEKMKEFLLKRDSLNKETLHQAIEEITRRKDSMVSFLWFSRYYRYKELLKVLREIENQIN